MIILCVSTDDAPPPHYINISLEIIVFIGGSDLAKIWEGFFDSVFSVSPQVIH